MDQHVSAQQGRLGEGLVTAEAVAAAALAGTAGPPRLAGVLQVPNLAGTPLNRSARNLAGTTLNSLYHKY